MSDWLDEILHPFYNRICATAGQSFAGDPYSILSKSAKAAIKAKLAEAEQAARIDELNRKMTLHIELLSSKDFKAGFSAALDQIDAANDLRIAQLHQRQAGED
jgi:hypothetical protein